MSTWITDVVNTESPATVRESLEAVVEDEPAAYNFETRHGVVFAATGYLGGSRGHREAADAMLAALSSDEWETAGRVLYNDTSDGGGVYLYEPVAPGESPGEEVDFLDDEATVARTEVLSFRHDERGAARAKLYEHDLPRSAVEVRGLQ